MFVVLFYVYPLKFLFTTIVNNFFGIHEVLRESDSVPIPIVLPGDGKTMMLVYNLGYIAIFLLFLLLYLYALSQRIPLDLNVLELHDTRFKIGECLIQMTVALISTVVVLVGGDSYSSIAGWSYGLLGPAMTAYGMTMGKRRSRLEEAL